MKEEQDRHEKEATCLQLFRLTNNDRDATYEWYKDRVEKRVENTCQWFLQHKHFQTWLKQNSGPLLVSADPGCGKSVLAKYLIDEVLPQPGTTICYFFFKDQDQSTIRQAICALLHQLFSQKPHLIKHALKEYRKDGLGLVNSTRKLCQILQDATEDLQAGSVIIVLDALDECKESELPDLVRHVESQFRSVQCGRLKYLLTCRPYEAILFRFYSLLSSFPKIRIPGEQESEAISQEIDHVIQHRLSQLSQTKGLSAEITDYLEIRLQKTTHRTYLWVYLIFDYLEKEDFKKTLKGVESTLVTLPRSVNEAYERILGKSKEDPMVRKALNIIFAATRPLTLAEMNAAVNIDISSRTVDLELEEDFGSRLRSWCGLFVSIHHGRIYFLHQTAREFLQQLSSPAITPLESGRWQHSISIHQAHAVLMEICQAYLIHIYNFLESNGQFTKPEQVSEFLLRFAFLNYSQQFVSLHVQQAIRVQDMETALPGSTLQVATSTEVSEKVNAVFTTLGGYSIWYNMC